MGAAHCGRVSDGRSCASSDDIRAADGPPADLDPNQAKRLAELMCRQLPNVGLLPTTDVGESINKK
jgi:hypothetical protein